MPGHKVPSGHIITNADMAVERCLRYMGECARLAVAMGLTPADLLYCYVDALSLIIAKMKLDMSKVVIDLFELYQQKREMGI